jgi:GTP-binding protein
VNIKTAQFVRSMKEQEDYFNDGVPEIAVAGKSNVGKSSLINYLTNNQKLARVSKQPGKTRLVNYFLINGEFYLVDLPGYGYARVSKEEKKSWGQMMDGYFSAAGDRLKLLVILTDIRHQPTQDDKNMVYFAEHYNIPYVVVATKADKIAKSKRKNEAVRISRNCGASIPPAVIPVSAQLKTGGEELLDAIEGALSV